MDKSPAIRENDQQVGVPGIGVAGQVFCPYGFQKSPCLKSGCELWVELSYGKDKVGRCAHSWQAILAVENRQEMEKLRHALAQKLEPKDATTA